MVVFALVIDPLAHCFVVILECFFYPFGCIVCYIIGLSITSSEPFDTVIRDIAWWPVCWSLLNRFRHIKDSLGALPSQ